MGKSSRESEKMKWILGLRKQSGESRMHLSNCVPGKPLEKITVKELCESARINKSTFYAHYKDIYDLSDAMEEEVGTVDCEQYPASGISVGASGRVCTGTSDGLCIAEFPDGDFIFRQSGESFCG
ncbi:TetR family HTH transcriptional regulator [human gut metagenome]|uniref:TetR family HTH transcriptional regulator n=1 Tax=human gut metagenome TaxID=408170 RepID=K1T963_9ZZZZ